MDASSRPSDDVRGVRVAVGVGSNRGDREEHLRFAARELERRLRFVKLSSVYRSPPAEGAAGGEFLNMCVAGLRDGSYRGAPGSSASELLEELRHVEAGAGRPGRRPERSERTLDLDLLLYGEHRIREEGLEVPHPRLLGRAFVLVPLAEVAPSWTHPENGRAVRELAAEVHGQLRRYEGSLRVA